MMSKYKCKYCGDIVERDSNKKHIKSYCTETGRNVYIKKVECCQGEQCRCSDEDN